MTLTANAHTHTSFCDGKNTAGEMAQAALALGFTGLGFSSHALEQENGTFGMQDEAAYRECIGALKEEYAGRMDILCGMEMDYFTPQRAQGLDYTIGSVHYFPEKGGRRYSVDASLEESLAALHNNYSGDWRAMVWDFYAMSIENIRRFQPTIAGHFDLIKKFNKDGELFDEQSEAYRSVALEVADEAANLLRDYGGILELNTAALKRGLAEPYPSLFILRHLAQKGTRVMINSDSHEVATLNFAFDKALILLKEAGFKSVAVLQNKAFRDVLLEG